MLTVRLCDDKKGIDTAAEILKAGGVVAMPTETVYGLAASAYSNTAISKVFAAKGRPQDNPLIVHISNMDMLSEVVSEFSDSAKILAEKFWPGPLTMVLPKGEKIADSVSRGLSTVAVRMPENKVAREVIRASGSPLAAPSANLSGSPSPTTANHVVADLDGKIDAIIMSDDCTVGVESTVVSLASSPPRLLRPGFVTAEQLREILPDLVIDKAVLEELASGEKAASPGMMYKHYSPKTEVFLVEAEEERFISFVNEKENSAAICFSEETDKIKIKALSLGSKNSAEDHAKRLFSLLRECDELAVDTVYIHAPSKSGVGLAVYNRLVRAAGFKVIKLKYVVGLTGPTGAGKTTACKAAEELGYKAINCDLIARQVSEREDALCALVDAFGAEILNEGKLNRKALAKIAFSSTENTELLNKTLLPFVVDLIKEEIEKSESQKILLDAPTLYESGADSLCRQVIAVLSHKENRKSRILSRDALSTADAELRLGAGKSDEYYKDKTQHIIYNNGDKSVFIEEFKLKLKTLEGK